MWRDLTAPDPNSTKESRILTRYLAGTRC